VPAQHQIFEMRHSPVLVPTVVTSTGTTVPSEVRARQSARDKREEGRSSVVGLQRV
jgi:hypothetical protein